MQRVHELSFSSEDRCKVEHVSLWTSATSLISKATSCQIVWGNVTLHIETSHESRSQKDSRVLSFCFFVFFLESNRKTPPESRSVSCTSIGTAHQPAAPLLPLPASLLLLRAAAARRRYATDACRGQFVRVSTIEARWAGGQCPATGPSVTPTVVHLFKEPPHRVRPCCTPSGAAQGAFQIEALIARLHGHSCDFLTVEMSQAKINMDKGMSRG